MSTRTLIQKIKRVFGLSNDAGSEVESDSSVEETEVTVERTADTATTETDPEPSSVSDDTEPSAIEEETDLSTAGVETNESTDDSDQLESESAPSEEGSTGTGEPVEKIKGIGPTYRDRLVASGFETVDDVAASDPETVAAAAEASEGRAADWVKRAQNR